MPDSAPLDAQGARPGETTPEGRSDGDLASNHGPLKGVRVAEVSTAVMGPLAARMLADLGADVIKIEAPEGDFPRHFQPARTPGMSGFWLNLNRNKRGVVLDLKRPEGREALLELVATCDVFLTNLRSRALTALKIRYEDLSAGRDDLIYCSGRGFGSDGPYAEKAAYDDVIQAASGLAALFERVTGTPSYVPSIVGDKVAALHIVQAVLAALYRRATNGRGDYIEVPMAEALASFNLVEHINGHAFEPPQGKFGYGRLMSAGRRPLRSADGWICVMPYSDENWRDFCSYAGRPEAGVDSRFATMNARVDNAGAMFSLLQELVAQRSTAQWMTFCDQKSIPAAPVVDLSHADEDPHFAAVKLLRTVEHPTEGPYRYIMDPLRFAAGSAGLWRHAPRLGEHTQEVLAEIGFDHRRIEDMTEATRPRAAAAGGAQPGVPA
jgi:crotonobetainyl-CoA:carnitine CoA-transferase CaiB-like acyl-CoA transferase